MSDAPINRRERFAAFFEAARVKLASWKVKLGLVGALVTVLAEEYFLGLIRRTLAIAGRGWILLAGAPVGYVAGAIAVILLIYVMGLLGLAWWETRPRTTVASVIAPLILSPEDQHSIHKMRVLWDESGHAASHNIAAVYDECVRRIQRDMERYYASLFRINQQEFNAKRVQVGVALEGTPTQSLDAICEIFKSWYHSYLGMVYWLQRFDANEFRLNQSTNSPWDHSRGDYLNWRASNKELVEGYSALIKWPEFSQRGFPKMSDEAAHRFLLDHSDVAP